MRLVMHAMARRLPARSPTGWRKTRRFSGNLRRGLASACPQGNAQRVDAVGTGTGNEPEAAAAETGHGKRHPRHPWRPRPRACAAARRLKDKECDTRRVNRKLRRHTEDHQDATPEFLPKLAEGVASQRPVDTTPTLEASLKSLIV